MSRWIVYFEDTPAMLPVRRAKGAEHIEYLKSNSENILIGGGLCSVPEAPFVGGLWVVEAEDYDQVLTLVLNDPYFVPEHRNFKILAWGKALDRTVSL
ncbi:hypothetical protein WH96_05910 [Kiloniella spongiae]|uniref:YCII-related domain-containing protein n=1 Tax=Kiloniella spongiae TaxID=1489064 RepID=A0A0H2MM56_9PROT|nr:YciI family protein [Kiloniella spongiae]KLN61822.1 hypothetical protein WH96_05910 [Kiloniella spongiae]